VDYEGLSRVSWSKRPRLVFDLCPFLWYTNLNVPEHKPPVASLRRQAGCVGSSEGDGKSRSLWRMVCIS